MSHRWDRLRFPAGPLISSWGKTRDRDWLKLCFKKQSEKSTTGFRFREILPESRRRSNVDLHFITWKKIPICLGSERQGDEATCQSKIQREKIRKG